MNTYGWGWVLSQSLLALQQPKAFPYILRYIAEQLFSITVDLKLKIYWNI